MYLREISKKLTGWITMKFGTGIHDPLRVNCNNSGDPPSFNLAPKMVIIQCSNTLMKNTAYRVNNSVMC